MRLATLAEDALGRRVPAWAAEVTVEGVAHDHRRVHAGTLFVARRGARTDAHAYIPAAVAAGAVAVVGEDALPERLPWGGVPYLRVPDARRALPQLAAVLHGRPGEGLTVVGVTGTDGKTTTAFLVHHLLEARRPAALLSTAAVRVAGVDLAPEGHFTTPEATEVQAFLARAREAGVREVVLESSSHGFSLHRLDAVPYAIGVWTNLTPEHLDHHGTFEAYREAKATLVRRARVAVLNRDDPSYPFFAAASNRVVSYGEHAEADLRLLAVEAGAGRLQLRWDDARAATGGRAFDASLPMVGRYNAHNALAAVAAATEAGLAPELAASRLATFPGVPGRMQVVQATPFTVLVDFAHTPIALAKALQAVRPPAPGRVLLVVGAAGERDPGKRAPLGAAAARGADETWFTEEDARSESVGAILQTLVDGARGVGGRPGETVHRVPDRRDAIREALAAARPGDVVLLAGKGHERTLERADEVVPWDEAGEARRWL